MTASSATAKQHDWQNDLIKANQLSNLLIIWCNRMLRYCKNHDLTDPEESFFLPKTLTTLELSKRFHESWDVKASEYFQAKKKFSGSIAEKRKPIKRPKLLSLYFKLFSREFFIAAIWFLAYMACVFTSAAFVLPGLLETLNEFEKGNEPTVKLGSLEIPYRGFYYALGFMISELGRSITVQAFWKMGYWVGLKARAMLISVLYEKVIRLGDSEGNTGLVINLIQTDSERIMQASFYFSFLLASPTCLITALILGFFMIGKAMLIGFVILLASTPIQLFLAKRIGIQRRKAVKLTDQRITLMGEILKAAQLIKMYAWESAFAKKIANIRDKEIYELRKSNYIKAINTSWTDSLVALCTLSTFSFHVLVLERELSAADAFSVLALFNACRFPLTIFTSGVRFGTESLIALRRMEDVLLREEFEPSEVPKRFPFNKDSLLVEIRNAKYSRSKYVSKSGSERNGDSTESDSTSSIDDELYIQKLEIKPGMLVIVAGRVGSGKTSLLTGAILGNIRRINSDDPKSCAIVRGSLSYVSQHPWVFNGTVKNNILMGRPFVSERFNEIVRICCLEPDLAMFPGREHTEMGESGINISGGQKTRIALARALYADSDLFILDDVLSAVDAHVSKSLFHDCILNYLVGKGKTVLLATHAVQYFSHAHHVVVVHDQKILDQGKYEDLLAKEESSHKTLLLECMSSQDEQKDELEEDVLVEVSMSPAQTNLDEVKMAGSKLEESPEEIVDEKREESTQKQKGKLLETEVNQVGAVGFKTLRLFAGGTGGMLVLLSVAFFFIASEATRSFTDAWLSFWTSYSFDTFNDEGYAAVFAGLVFSSILLLATRGILFAYICLKSATRIHNTAFRNLIKAKMSYFHVTQLGVILNRFSGDMDRIDVILVDVSEQVLGLSCRVISALVLIIIVLPYFALAVIPVIFIFHHLLKYCRAILRQLKRLESMSKSPLISHCQSTVRGIQTIKAFEDSGRYIEISHDLTDLTTRNIMGFIFANRWIGMRLDFVTCWIITFAAVFAVIFAESISPSLAGLVVTSALQTAGFLQFGTRQFAEMEAHLTSVERLRHFIDTIPQEKPITKPSEKILSVSWPEKGKVEFKDYSVSYRPGLPKVLDNISFIVEGGTKAAFTGRTGSGKSTTLLCLFRIMEALEGSILIDGVDIASVPLQTLRSNAMCIVPQDAVMFRGNVRSNLDPFHNFTDEQIWDALERVHMTEKKDGNIRLLIGKEEELAVGLDYLVTEGGENLSKGQRQLFCFARALLRNTKIICIDEGTSSVDETSDQLIQQTLRDSFSSNTLLIIAHRLNTVREVDKIFVLDSGKLIEAGTPDELIATEGGHFAEMWQAQIGLA